MISIDISYLPVRCGLQGQRREESATPPSLSTKNPRDDVQKSLRAVRSFLEVNCHERSLQIPELLWLPEQLNH
jgi:hypothetical protein